MKKVIWKNQDLEEPLCFDEDGSLVDYDPEKEGHGELLILENGYGYWRPEGDCSFWDDYVLCDQPFDNYVDEKHQPSEY